ncbi:hypothetical protein FVE85_6179 [Porphyridium purpureum]|uniref:Uncharacterized protein n=1 Tax=Porphyridium purpureum TaxID=35688 RepID=A0A5J4Z6H3_PORPP|nr:hypothetical protein FVE85_6179 [Porphyridium purpureum]|eukprot:POR6442..scf295_1
METGVKSAELDAAQHALKCAQLLLGGWDQTEALSDPKTTRSPNPQGSETAVLAAQRVSMGIRMAARGYSRDVNRGGPVWLAGGDGPDATFRSRMAEAGAPFDSKLCAKFVVSESS